MLFTFFVAIFFRFIAHQFKSDVNFIIYPVSQVEAFLFAVGISACWTGTIACLRLKPLEDKKQSVEPGELICVAEGIYFVVVLTLGGLVGLYYVDSDADGYLDSITDLSMLAWAYCAVAAVLAVTYLIWGLKQPDKLWRYAAFSKAVAHLVAPFVLALQLSVSNTALISASEAFQVTIVAAYLCSTLFVIVAAIIGFRRRSYRWTHWLGIGAFSLTYLTRVVVEIKLLLDTFENP